MKKENYIIYKGFVKVTELPNLDQVGRYFGTKRQNIHKGKKAEGFYSYKGHYIVNKHKWEGKGYFDFLRLKWYFENPATSFQTCQLVKDACDRLEKTILN